MIRFIALLMLSCLLPSLSQSSEIATVMGKPGEDLDFTQNIIQERINFGEPKIGEDSATRAYSILARRGVKSAVSIEVANDDGTVYFGMEEALHLAAAKAPVVFTNLGPIENNLCDLLSQHKEAAFVVVAGNDASYLDPVTQPKCLASNILRVAALNQEIGELASFTNYGDPLVRIAAPSFNILSYGLGGKEGRSLPSTAGASLVAARVALYARENPLFKGSELIDHFLSENSISLPKLRGKVEGGRALVDGG